jgi:hypothetical protein
MSGVGDDKAMRARADGRAKMAERTAWTLDANGLAVRCVKVRTNYVVQARVGKWSDLGLAGPDPLFLLRAVVSTKSVQAALAALREAGG